MASPVAVRLRTGIQRAGTLTLAQVASSGLRRHRTPIVLDGFAAHDYRLPMHHFAPMLRASGFLNANAKTGDLLLIVGYTDRSPSDSAAVHRGLSLMRALEVKRFLSELLDGVSVQLVAIVGPEDRRLTPGRNEAERRRNRRVELDLWRLP
jgi:flagellar motor protein MotB